MDGTGRDGRLSETFARNERKPRGAPRFASCPALQIGLDRLLTVLPRWDLGLLCKSALSRWTRPRPDLTFPPRLGGTFPSPACPSLVCQNKPLKPTHCGADWCGADGLQTIRSSLGTSGPDLLQRPLSSELPELRASPALLPPASLPCLKGSRVCWRDRVCSARNLSETRQKSKRSPRQEGSKKALRVGEVRSRVRLFPPDLTRGP